MGWRPKKAKTIEGEYSAACRNAAGMSAYEGAFHLDVVNWESDLANLAKDGDENETNQACTSDQAQYKLVMKTLAWFMLF